MSENKTAIAAARLAVFGVELAELMEKHGVIIDGIYDDFAFILTDDDTKQFLTLEDLE